MSVRIIVEVGNNKSSSNVEVDDAKLNELSLAYVMLDAMKTRVFNNILAQTKAKVNIKK